MLHAWLIKRLQTALAEYQAQDPSIPQQLQLFRGKRLKLSIAELPSSFYIEVRERLTLLEHTNAAPDSEVSLTLSSLPQLVNTEQLTTLLKQDKLVIHGDLQLAAKVLEVLRHCQFEPEEWLAGKLGDAPAYHIHRRMLKLLQRGKQWHSETEQDVQEWLQDEIQLTPSAIEVELFKRQVTQTEQAAAALQQRIQTLTNKL